MSSPSILALIPARGGSKRLPRKNVLPIDGKPVISYTFDAALGAKRVTRVVLTTDDEAMASIARERGVEVPFLRPQALADDFTTVGDAACHAVEWLEQEQGFVPDFVIILQPSSPLRRAEHVDEAVEACLQAGADGVMSVCEPDYHPFWMAKPDDGHLRPFESKGLEYQRKQDLPPVYRPNGAIYLYRRDVLLRQGELGRQGLLSLIEHHTILPYIMAPEESANIDTASDLRLAEYYMGLRERSAPDGRSS